MYPPAHLLSIPRETRDSIYTQILKDIHNEQRTLESPPVSSYDGLAQTCRQLHEETQESVFCFKYKSSQLNRTLHFNLDRTNFENMRSVTLEISLNAKPGVKPEVHAEMYRGIGKFLQNIQLSLQELHLIFIGKDRRGVVTNMHGCGEKQQPNLPDNMMLSDGGQDFEHQWGLIRCLAILRNLRTLRIQNANIPLSTALLCNNKPYLRSLSVTSDRRSVSSSLNRIKIPLLHLYRNIGVKVSRFPQVKVLNLSVNSAPDAEGIVAGVSPYLEHFSWRVPNPDLQIYRQRKSFYSQTNQVIENLSWRGPQLTTLRLCLSMRDREERNEQVRQEFGVMTANLSFRLHAFPQLKRLEIHYRGDQGPGGFFRTELIERLPPSLSRLYLSDNSISVAELVEQVHKRYFTYLEDWTDAKPTPFHRNLGFCRDEDGETYSAAEVQLNAEVCFSELLISPQRRMISCGERRYRTDDIPLTGGSLGFINFEYDCTDDDDDRLAALYNHYESDGIKLLRLNGQLLDREHNLHFANHPRYSPMEGMKPCQADPIRYSVDETAVSSQYPELRDAISQREELTTEEQLAIETHQQELSKSLDDWWDWYFGNEDSAQEVFMQEAVAEMEDQRQKPEMMEVEVGECDRCRWACPDHQGPPVGSFPAPKIPLDWQDYV